MATLALAAGNHGGGSGFAPAVTGNDISYPQCGAAFPSSPAFGIVGVNGGLANDLNPCLGPSASYPSYRQLDPRRENPVRCQVQLPPGLVYLRPGRHHSGPEPRTTTTPANAPGSWPRGRQRLPRYRPSKAVMMSRT